MSDEAKITREREWKREQLRKILEYFKDERYKCLDEIPAEICTAENDPHYYLRKCRKSFFTGISRRISTLIEHQIVTEPGRLRQGREFIDFVQSLKDKPRIEKEDIDKANKILEIFIEHLSQLQI